MKFLKTLAVVLALMFAGGTLKAQSILVYSGGMNISRQALTGTLGGVFLSPIAQLSWQPLVFENGQITITQDTGGAVGYALSFGKIGPDPLTPGGIQVSPEWVFDIFAGDGFLKETGQNGRYINQGIFGFGIGRPSVFGNLMPTIAFPIPGGPVQVGLAFTASFDVANGLGLIKL